MDVQSNPINSLDSYDVEKPLSANMGRVLNSKILNMNNISDLWNASSSYNPGDLVINDNMLWKCLVANTNTEPAEGTYWTQTTIDAELSAVNSSLIIDSFKEYKTNLGVNVYTVGSIVTEIISKVNNRKFFHTRVDGSVIENISSERDGFSWINIDTLLGSSKSYFGVSTIEHFVGGYGTFRYYPNLFASKELIGFAPIIIFNENAIELSRIYDLENGSLGSWPVNNIPTGIFGFDIYWVAK